MGRSRGAGLGKQLAAVGAQPGRTTEQDREDTGPSSTASQRAACWEGAQCCWSRSVAVSLVVTVVAREARSRHVVRSGAGGSSSLARLACHKRISSRQPRAP